MVVMDRLEIHREHIGPDRASMLLSNMSKNRRVNQARLDQYRRAMENGDWQFEEGSPIKVSEDGNLLDGQHRLLAVVETGIAQDFFLLTGVPETVMDVMDTGKQRSFADFLHMEGEINCGELAAAVSILLRYKTDGYIAKWGSSRNRPTIPELVRFFADHHGLRGSVVRGKQIRRKLKGGAGRWAGLHYIFTEVDPVDTEDFFNKAELGEDLPAGDPILALRKRLLDDINSPRRLAEIEYTALVLKSWNYYRRGQTIKHFQWRGGGANPEPYPTPG